MNLKRGTVEALLDLMDIPSVYGYETADTLRKEILGALTAPRLADGSLEYHVCNEVASTIKPFYPVGYSYEDRDLASVELAEDFFHALDRIVPGHFVLISTGDYIMTTCGDEGNGYHREARWDCETYDPRYWYYLVPRHEWELQKEDVMRRDAAWRNAKMQCSCPQKVALAATGEQGRTTTAS